MIGSYLEEHELEQLNKLLKEDDTMTCWIGTRVKGHSASMVCDGNISTQLMKMLDDKILPLIKKDNNFNQIDMVTEEEHRKLLIEFADKIYRGIYFTWDKKTSEKVVDEYLKGKL